MTLKYPSFPIFYVFLSVFIWSCTESKTTTYSDEIEVEKLAETSQSWNGSDIPAYGEGTPKVTVLKITIPPNSKLEMHKHLVMNAGFLLSGKLTVIDEYGNTKVLHEGEALVELVNTYHYGVNKEDIPAEIVVVYAGTVGVPITVLKE